MPETYDILIMGASYGSLLASKLLFGGHSVKLVCLPAEADLINAEGFRVRMPVRGRKDSIEIDSRKLPGKVSAGGPAEVDPAAGGKGQRAAGDLADQFQGRELPFRPAHGCSAPA